MIDTVSGELSLKPDKLMELIDLMQKFLGRKRASRRQMEQLAGKLCWAAHVVPWGTAHTRPIFTLLSSLKASELQRTNLRYQMGPHLVAIMAAKWPESQAHLAANCLFKRVYRCLSHCWRRLLPRGLDVHVLAL